MPETSHIIRLRERRRSRPKAGLFLSLGSSAIFSLLLATLSLLGSAAFVLLVSDLPSPDILISLMDIDTGLLNNPTQLLDRSGQQVIATLRHPAASRATYMFVPDDFYTGDQPPPISSRGEGDPRFSREIITASIALTDPTFWQHSGFTLTSITRDNQPTLARQLASELLLWDEPASIRRTLREYFLAAQITHRYGRGQILEWYLNTAQYGKLIFGVDAAARVYFGKPATTLNLSEAVWLAMQAKNPNLPPSPDDFDRILNEMQASNWISQQDREEARMPDPTSSLAADAYTSIAPGFTDYTLSRLSNRYNLERILRGGLKITTSLNDILQLQVTCATYTQLNRSGTRVENSILPEDHDCQAERLLPTLSGPAGSPPGQLAANVIILDPTNGQILAYVDDPNSNLDPAGLPGHPPGSLLTPFIYLTSFTRGFTPASLLWDIPSEEVMAEIDNLDRQEHGPMRLRIAMANDYLVPAAQIMNRIGFDNIQRTMQQFGLLPFYNDEGSLPDNLDQSILIEGGELTLLDAVQALGILANQGVASGIPAANVESADDPFGTVEPVVVLDIRDTDNHQWAQVPTNRNQPILSTQLAYLVTNILSDEGARWPTLGHPNALEIGRPAAVKPGTTIAGQDVWTVGYTPQMVVGVWVGRVNPENEPPLSEQLSAALWHALMQFAHRDLPTQNWIKPSGITSLDVCDPSGLLPSPDCPTVVSEIFLAGTEPIQVDNLYRAVQINRETGLLATIYTPSDLVEERVYLQVPPDAISWAQQTEISIPPNMYDLVKSSSQDDPNAIISSPSMFSIVGNQVSIIGSAAGEDFSRYRIQIGRGLNPTAWLQIGDDITKPVQEAELFEWDTQGLNGLYTLQLLVERNEQQVDTSTIQVTIDNQAPEVAILYPQLNQVIELSDITIQADIEDNLRVARVRVLIDDQVLSQLDQPPYSTVWKTQPGEHTLTIEAMDEAGNLSTANLRFTVR